MAVSSILAKFLTVVTPTWSFASIANGAGRVCSEIDNTVVKATKGLLSVKITAGTTPTLNGVYKLYLIRNSNDATNIQAGATGTATLIGTADAAVATEPLNSPIIGVIVITAATTGLLSQEVFLIENPGPKFSIVAWNASGVTTNATGGNHIMQWSPIVEEAQ